MTCDHDNVARSEGLWACTQCDEEFFSATSLARSERWRQHRKEAMPKPQHEWKAEFKPVEYYKLVGAAYCCGTVTWNRYEYDWQVERHYTDGTVIEAKGWGKTCGQAMTQADTWVARLEGLPDE